VLEVLEATEGLADADVIDGEAIGLAHREDGGCHGRPEVPLETQHRQAGVAAGRPDRREAPLISPVASQNRCLSQTGICAWQG
jgi:hypothetical protein